MEHVVPFDMQCYDLEAIRRACYKFTDRCTIFVTRPGRDVVEVHLQGCSTVDEAEALGRAITNEVLDQQVRQDIYVRTEYIRDIIYAQAFAEGDLLDVVRNQATVESDPLNICSDSTSNSTV